MSAHVSLDVSKVGLFSHLEDQFTNSSTFVRELLQNARRAGASKVWITVDDAAGTLTVADDGCGVDKPEHLFTLGRSGFAENDDGLSSERPFGMGFCAALFTASRIRVATREFSCDFIPKDALAFAPIAIGQGGFDGTEVCLWLTDDRIDAIRHLYRLNSERTVSSVFEHALEKEVAGFPIPVLFNGREIERPDSIDKGFQPCKAGLIRVDFERRRGEMQRRGDFPRLYGQGLALLRLGPDTWKRKDPDGEVVIHLGSQFRLRVPDREAIVQEQHSLASELIREAIAEVWAEFLEKQARELSGYEFVRAWFGAALTYQPHLLNDKPLPISVFEVLDAPLSNNQDRFSPYRLEAEARAFAAYAHESVGQLRRYTALPYIVHPAAVAELVRTVPHTEEMLAAAWLHDVVEDTPVTLREIEMTFGAAVAELVDWLTDVSRPEDGNREARMALDRAHSAKATPAAQTVKLADVIDNTCSVMRHDPRFARTYLYEKRLLVGVLQGGDRDLRALALAVIDGA